MTPTTLPSATVLPFRARSARARGAQAGAAMVEAICVISIFIMFFVAMVYFQSLYHQKIRAQELAHAGAIAYAMDACKDGDPLKTVSQDLNGAKNNNSGSQPGTASTVNVPSSNKPVGNQGGDPVGSAMKDQGFALDPIAGISVQGPAAGTTKQGTFSKRIGWTATVSSDSYVSCGDEQKDGTAGAAFDYVKGLFKK